MTAPAPALERDDESLSEHISRGAYREAVAISMSHYGAHVGRFCMALLGSQCEADDAAQEVFLVAYRSFASYRGDGSVRAWLFGIARRVCAKRMATAHRRGAKLHLVHDATEAEEAADDALQRRRRAELIRDKLRQLRPTEREALVLRYLSGLSYREIAEACDIDEAAARKRTSRALARLRTFFQNQEAAR